MTSTHILLIALVTLLAVALAIPALRTLLKDMASMICLLFLFSRTKRRAQMRTANRRLIDEQIKSLRRQVPDAPLPPQVGPNLEQVRTSAIAAALIDIGQHTTTLNPHKLNTAAHAAWRCTYDNYKRMHTPSRRPQQTTRHA